jgi:hypothetical protein
LKKIILAMALMLIPTLAFAAEPRPDRPHWSLELKGGAFFPDISSWSTSYGSSYMGEYGGALSYKVLRQIEVGMEGSYSTATGTGLQPLHGTQSGEVTFERAPLDLFVLGRGVFNENQLLVPYAGGGYTRMFYREDVKGQGKTKGSVNGYHARAGVQVLLDGLESDAANNLYQDYGIHHTYFFLEGKYTRAMADTISDGSVNIGGTSYLGGFMFEF